MNAVQLIDLPAIKAMCIAWEQAEKSRRVIDTQGYFTLGSMGQMIEHPALKAYNSASTLFLRYAQEFGLTTVARTRLGLLDVQRKSIQAEMDWTLGPSTRRTDG
jgi:P27 family predicted phage terminase small subunit